MKIETLKERIEKANAKIEKKQNTIEKKLASIEKKSATLNKKYGIDAETFNKYDKEARDSFGKEAGNEIYWTLCDIGTLKEDIKRGNKEIEATKKTIKKYEAQLAGEIEKESILIKEIPNTMKQMQTELVEQWDAWDIKRKANLREQYNELGYKKFIKIHKCAGYDFMYKTDEEIHESNVKDAKMLIIDLYSRVKNITGEVTDWANIHAQRGTQGMTVLNGYVIGEEGRAKVESILAGGYNIQRLHVRVLVKEY